MPDNAKHGPPRLVGGDPLPLSRGKILDGTVPVYFGPRQLPNCAPGFRVRMADDLESPDQTPGDAFSEIEGVYTPPTEWPEAGRLLRIPQVAWLSFCFPSWQQTYHFEYAETRYGVGIAEDAPLHTVGACGYIVSGAAYGPVDGAHPEVAENARIKAAFAEAKSRVEALRPGRTWVQIVDWLDEDNTGTSGYQIADNFAHLTAPPWSFLGGSGPYFGVDFLHVYAGSLIEDRKIEENNYVRLTDFIYGSLTGNFAHLNSVDRVKAAASHFAGFRVALYWTDLDPPAIPPYEFEPDFAYHSFGYPDYHLDPDGGASPDGDPPAGTYCVMLVGETEESNAALAHDGAAAAAADRTAFINGELDAYRAALEAHYEATRDNMELSVAALGWDDADGPAPVEVAGTTPELTADSIVALIADHFGFDPDTGADLI